MYIKKRNITQNEIRFLSIYIDKIDNTIQKSNSLKLQLKTKI